MRVEDLRRAFVFDGLTDAQLLDLISVGEEVHFAEGDVLFREGEPAESWWVLLEGRVELTRRVGREYVAANVMDKPGIWAGGFRAWYDAAGYLTTGQGTVAGRMFRVPSDALGERARAWFPFGVHIIEGFFQTVRKMEELSHQRDALIALGTLAAGLAHEINNPAAAATRAVDALQTSSDTSVASLLRLVERSIPAEQLLALDALRHELSAERSGSSPLVVVEREDAITEWLEAHEVDGAWDIAPALAAAGADVAWCERAAAALAGSALTDGLAWVASTQSTAALLSEVKESTSRIAALVGAAKSYSQLDRASVQLIDVTEGIDSTLVMLTHKLRDGVNVVREYTPDLPRIEANAGELNQVWTNLVDNAVDAMDGRGTLRVSTRAVPDGVVVEIADTGVGMSADVQAHAFDPFFTTKDVGKGTGLGLDISRRIVVERHCGGIEIDSRPGETVLSVRLPLRHAAAP